VDRVLDPGGDGANEAASRVPDTLLGAGRQATVLPDDETPAYAFTLAFQDLAATQDVLDRRVRGPAARGCGARWTSPGVAWLGGRSTCWSSRRSRRSVAAQHSGTSSGSRGVFAAFYPATADCRKREPRRR
jgi:hypothetical protein